MTFSIYINSQAYFFPLNHTTPAGNGERSRKDNGIMNDNVFLFLFQKRAQRLSTSSGDDQPVFQEEFFFMSFKNERKRALVRM